MRELFSYVERFKDERFVARIDDALLDSDSFPALIADLARCARIGVRVVIVAGARSRIDSVLGRYERSSRMIAGVRISEASAMPLIEMAAFDSATKIMTRMTGEGVDAVIGNWVRARTLGVVDGIDFEQTGVVDRIDLSHLDRLIDDGVIPILPCIGWNRRGQAYNLSSTKLACELAKRIHARKLIFCNNDRIDLPSRLTNRKAADLVAASVIGPERDFLSHSIEAISGGVRRVHALDASNEGALLFEVFTNIGTGTMVFAEGYESVRPLTNRDIPAVLSIMKPHVESDRLLLRTESDISNRFDEMYVYDIDGTVHGVIGLEVFDDRTGEIYSLAVDTSVAQLGVGKQLLRKTIDEARQKKLTRIVACTTQAFDWFHEFGFEPTTIETLPPERRAQWLPERNSRVIALELDR